MDIQLGFPFFLNTDPYRDVKFLSKYPKPSKPLILDNIIEQLKDIVKEYLIKRVILLIPIMYFFIMYLFNIYKSQNIRWILFYGVYYILNLYFAFTINFNVLIQQRIKKENSLNFLKEKVTFPPLIWLSTLEIQKNIIVKEVNYENFYYYSYRDISEKIELPSGCFRFDLEYEFFPTDEITFFDYLNQKYILFVKNYGDK